MLEWKFVLPQMPANWLVWKTLHPIWKHFQHIFPGPTTAKSIYVLPIFLGCPIGSNVTRLGVMRWCHLEDIVSQLPAIHTLPTAARKLHGHFPNLGFLGCGFGFLISSERTETDREAEPTEKDASLTILNYFVGNHNFRPKKSFSFLKTNISGLAAWLARPEGPR